MPRFSDVIVVSMSHERRWREIFDCRSFLMLSNASCNAKYSMIESKHLLHKYPDSYSLPDSFFLVVSIVKPIKETACTIWSSRSASVKAAGTWKSLQKQQWPRRNPCCAYEKRMTNAALSKKLQEHGWRTKVAIEENAVQELQNLAEYYVPDLSDTYARVLALRMYYIELADGVSPNDAQEKVGKMFLICKCTVERWAASWEQTFD